MPRSLQALNLPPAAWLIAMLLVLAAPFAVRAEVAVPELSRRVTDFTATLTPDTVNRLESTLAQFEAAKGSQIAVLMLPTTEPEDIAQFGIRVAEQWKIGREKADDGAILIIARDDRAVRIEVGYGLEGVLPDAVTKRIIEEDIVPRFRQGDFSGGVEAGVSRMMRLIEGEPLPPPKPASRGGDNMDQLVLFLFAGIIGGKILGAVLGKGLGSSVAAAGTGALAWLFSGVFFFGVTAAVIVLFMTLAGGRGGGHWGSGGFGGGSWGGGGGGGWSGGGGGFGGGGASGRW